MENETEPCLFRSPCGLQRGLDHPSEVEFSGSTEADRSRQAAYDEEHGGRLGSRSSGGSYGGNDLRSEAVPYPIPPVLLLPVDHPTLRHKADSLEDADIGERIAWNGNDVRPIAWLQRSNLILPAE